MHVAKRGGGLPQLPDLNKFILPKTVNIPFLCYALQRRPEKFSFHHFCVERRYHITTFDLINTVSSDSQLVAS